MTLDRYALNFQPWSNWTAGRPPKWWTANNKVKHERHNEFEKANLKNCLNAVAGVFAAALYLYRDKAESGQLAPSPTLLEIPGALSNGMNAHPPRFYYRLP